MWLTAIDVNVLTVRRSIARHLLFTLAVDLRTSM